MTLRCCRWLIAGLVLCSLGAPEATAQEEHAPAAGAHAADTAHATADAEHAPAEHETAQFDALHHVEDGFYLDFQPFAKVELPRLFLVRGADGGLGLDAYASTSSALRSGDYRLMIERREGDVHPEGQVQEELMASGEHLETEMQRVEGRIVADLSVTRHLVFGWIGSLLVALVFITMARRYARGVGRDTAPKGLFQNLFETLFVFVRDEIAKPNLGEKYKKFLPYLLTAFFFILFNNLIGLVPFGATATANIAITAVLAVFTFVITQVSASKDHWRHVLWPPGVPAFVKPILIPVEILGLFTKPFALAIRLFANMTAGHLVILSLIGLIFAFTNIFGAGVGYGVSPVSIALALFIYCLEILVAFLQAYVFTMLSALFIGMAAAEHHHEEHEHEHHLAPLGGDAGQHLTPEIVTGAHGTIKGIHAEPSVSPT